MIPGTIRETVGQGVELDEWSLGRDGWKTSNRSTGATVLAQNGKPVAQFHTFVSVRPDVRSEIAALRSRGLALQILSGDQTDKVKNLAAALDLPAGCGLGELTPQAKAAWLQEHDREDTLMLGDGANDSLAFDAAYCRGTPIIHRDILAQKADFYYLGQGIGGIRALFEINALRRGTEIAILTFSVFYNLLAVGFAVTGHINPLIAAILMPANSVLTLLVVSLGMQPAFKRKKAPLAEQTGPKVVVGPGFEPGKA